MRLPFLQRGPGGPPRLPYGITPQTLLRGLGKLVATIVVAALAGLTLGTALATLSGDDESSTSSPDNSPGASSPATMTTPTTADDEKPASAQSLKPPSDVRVRIVSAVLRPATTARSKRRRRARLTVHVRVTNRGSRRISPARPVLVSGDDRVKTDPNQDTAETHLGAINPGETRDVTLRFEIAGTVTQRVQQELRARLIIAGRNRTAPVKGGDPISRASDPQRTSSRTTTQPPPAPPPAPPAGAAGSDSSG